MSLDTHGVSEMDGVYSVYNTPQDVGSGCSSDNPEHYDTPISCASPTPPSAYSKPLAHHTPLLKSGSPRSEPFSDVGLRRACNTALSQSSSSCVNAPGGLDPRDRVGVATRGESRSEEWRDSREGQEGGGDPVQTLSKA